MMTSVPQFIDVEDKVAGPLTWKQLGWMIAMGVALFLLYTIFSGILFYLIAVPIAVIFIALAFFRPNGMAFPQFLFYSVTFFFRPKVSVWERPTRQRAPSSEPLSVVPSEQPKKEVTRENFAALAKQVDRK